MSDWVNLVRRELAPLRLTPAAESDLAEELAQHLDDFYQELRSGGATHDAAYQLTVAELADASRMQSELRGNQRLPRRDAVPAGDRKPATLLEGLWRDLRYAARTMRKSPLFVLVVVGTLALGIGANTTVFTIINTLILNPLPVAHAMQLVAISTADVGSASKSGIPFPISYPDLADYQNWNGVFTSLAGYTSPRGITWQQQGNAEGLFGELVTTNYFSTLGLAPVKGRFFSTEDGARGAAPAAVINYKTWQTRLGGAAGIIGKTLQVNNIVITIVGVAPPDFIGLNAVFGPDLWLPATLGDRLFPVTMRNAFSDRAKPLMLGVGRLKPGVTQLQAQANLATIASSLARAYPAANENHTITVRPIRDALFAGSGSQPDQVEFAAAALLTVVFIVLLIACSNVANLLLARSAARQQEMAVRLAMGASRSRLVRQLLTESVLLGILSGVFGLVVGYAGLKLVFATLPLAANFVAPKLDGAVFLFALIVSLVTGLLFGGIPAFKASGTTVAETLKEGARTSSRSRKKVTTANALLVGQVAFSFLLLVLAALFLRSIQRAYALDPGFQTAHLAVFPTNPGQAGYAKPQVTAFYKEVRERVAAIPGVESSSWASNMPLWARPVSGLQIEGRPQRSRSETLKTIVITIDRGYFATTGIPIDSGRAFSDLDRATSTPVAIINQKAAHDYWPGGALGKRIQLPGEQQMRLIVGVAGTANYTSWGEAPQACVYLPLDQNYSDSMVLYVRSNRDPAEVLLPAEREIHAAGPQILIFGTRTGPQIIDGGLFQAKIGVAMLTVFGLLALALASIGLYGILAYSVNQRKREIGVRMALGATRGSVLGLVMKQGMSLVFTGVLLGFGAALLAGRLLSSLLYGVNADDPLSLAAAALLLSAVALLACYLPAHWATRVDPLQALHEA
jgi:predicted permease